MSTASARSVCSATHSLSPLPPASSASLPLFLAALASLQTHRRRPSLPSCLFVSSQNVILTASSLLPHYHHHPTTNFLYSLTLMLTHFP
ncbi:hypothetical protein DL89DRAFT_179339 [Linderina pennispora]|uniref:Uncharacterized protein n=1 Tax=Linderina pennispora TaxID=61395 RepID=A0A1Y1W554_9FUNG|nr:uncharacterized protein DL89DRAFT_179339 [Linderina pennispora]ORX68532.1 hypothetical protein DL89DRAFT_179339 [Linderina pennispora]